MWASVPLKFLFLDGSGKLAGSTIPDFLGDVTGPYSATVVGGIQGRPVVATAPGLNEILRWNGTAWAPSADAGITALTGDVTASGSGSVVATLSNNVVTTPKMFANPGRNRLVATDNTSGATLVPFECNLDEIMQWTVNGWACVSVSSAVSGASFQNNGNSFAGPATLGTNDSNPLYFETNDSVKVSILTNGYVGIGTTLPGRLLEVNGSARFVPTTAPSSPVAGDVFFDSAAGNALKYYNGTAWQTVNTGSGFAMAGVNSDITALNALTSIGGAFRVVPSALPGSPTAGTVAMDSSAGNALKYYNGSTWISLAVGGTGDFLADGSVPMTGAFRGIAGNAGAPGITFFSATPQMVCFAPATNNFAIATAGQERLRVLANGRIGIGTSTPGPNWVLQVLFRLLVRLRQAVRFLAAHWSRRDRLVRAQLLLRAHWKSPALCA